MHTNQNGNPFFNSRGEALLLALALTFMGLISTLAIIAYTTHVQSNSKLPRLKSMMTSLEAKVRSLLLQPSSYECSAGQRSSCRLQTTRITSLGRNIPQAKCPSHSPCGFTVSVLDFQNSLVDNGESVTRTKVKIHYEGLEVSLHDLDFEVDAPADLLQSQGIYNCPPEKPKFNGFLANGKMDCTALPPIVQAGQFVNSIDPFSLTISSSTLPSHATCSGNEMIGQVRWGNGGNSFTYSCSLRGDPFAAFGFAPKEAPTGDVSYVPNPDYP